MTNEMETVMRKEADGSEDVYSKVVRAGRRTYFFDVKATRGNDYFLTITESRKKADKDGEPYFEKHKIHLYKEDFLKYTEGLAEVIDYIKAAKPQFFENEENLSLSNSYTLTSDENFDSLLIPPKEH